MTFELTASGEPIGADRFYVGAYGLGLLHNPVAVQGPADYRLAVAPRGGPKMVPGLAAGAYFYCDVGGAQANAATPEDAESLDSEVRALMKDWGYTGK